MFGKMQRDKDNFIKQWKSKFPDEEPPDLICLEKTSEKADMVDTLAGIKNDIAALRDRLAKKEFIGMFLNSILQRGSTESQLDEMIPIVLPENGNPFAGKELYKFMGEGGDYYSPVAGEDKFYDNQPMETDLDMYMNKDTRPSNLRKKGSLTDSGRQSPAPSDGSSGSPALDRHSKPPVPIPRASRTGPSPANSIKGIRREVKSPKDDGLDTVIKIDRDSDIRKSGRQLSDSVSPTSPMTTFGGSGNKNENLTNVSSKGSFSYQNKGITDEEKVKLGLLKGHLNNNVIDRANSQNDDDGEASSDEEAEPVYYNLMLIAKQQMNKSRMSVDNNLRESIYASVDVHKRQVEQDAHQLSRRFSSYVGMVGGSMDSKNLGTMTVGRSFTARPKLGTSALAEVKETDDGPPPTLEELFNKSKAAVIAPAPKTSIKPSGSVNKSGKPAPAIAKKPNAPTLKGRGQIPATNPHRTAPMPPEAPKSAAPSCGAQTDDQQSMKKRHSMMMATSCQGQAFDGVVNEIEPVEITSTVNIEQLQMRKWVVTSILDSERVYVEILDTLQQYMRSFEAAAKSSQPVIGLEFVNVIFYKIPELTQIHADFIARLEPTVEKWNPQQEVAEAFKMMALEEYPVAGEYLTNYHKAMDTIKACAEENEQFARLTDVIKCKGMTDVASLTELLHKPVVRIQRNTLVLHDLIKCTPTEHADYDMLQKTLKISQNFLETQQPGQSEKHEHQRYMVRNCLVVEKVGKSRKLRHIFLFNDVLVCTKQKTNGRRIQFEVKWCISMFDLTVDSRAFLNEEKQMEENGRHELQQLQKNISDIQTDLRKEMKASRMANDNTHIKGRSWSFRGNSRNIEKQKKKLIELEATLVVQSPHLILRMRKGAQKKNYTLLMSSDYERNDWRETIKGLKLKVNGPAGVTVVEIQNLVNSIDPEKLDSIGSVLEKQDLGLEEEYLFGSLNVTIHKLNGLKSPADTLCCMEVDSYSHFYMKAKTNIIAHQQEPVWNESFEIDLDAAQTIRFLCYTLDGDGENLIGKCALELSKAWLRGDFQEKTISIKDGLSITVSVCYVSRDQVIKRTLSSAKTGLFGQRLNAVAKRERQLVPIIVTTCVNEVELRGLDDLGIYRVSGVSSAIHTLKKAFERNSKSAIPLVRDADINCVTGLMKLYLRELPEALFTHVLYPSFNEGMALSDPEAKQKCMLSLFRNLPEPNQTTARYIISHLINVASHESSNKMSLNNLATVFGPTLLRPAASEVAMNAMDLFSMGAREAMVQTSILYFFMELHAQGTEL